jgi:hypothetical protein
LTQTASGSDWWQSGPNFICLVAGGKPVGGQDDREILRHVVVGGRGGVVRMNRPGSNIPITHMRDLSVTQIGLN